MDLYGCVQASTPFVLLSTCVRTTFHTHSELPGMDLYGCVQVSTPFVLLSTCVRTTFHTHFELLRMAWYVSLQLSTSVPFALIKFQKEHGTSDRWAACLPCSAPPPHPPRQGAEETQIITLYWGPLCLRGH